MESRISAIVSNPNEPDFNAVQFEKKLMQLKDSQESINSMSAWCLENRLHHKKIVNAWLSVLKKVKVEQRLTLFYLANDVIQYSKRKNYDFVESWGTTLQKATTLVREEKVKNRILRIFKIWEQRGIYGEEFIADLSGLISASPAGRKLDTDPQEFQPSYLINRIRNCAKLESDTDLKLKHLKDSSPKITDSETLCASLKDRQHVEDVEKEVESGITLTEAYVNALKAEIKSRTHLVSVLGQADTFYSIERKEVKVVVSAYKNFTTRVKNLKRKLDELTPTLGSPIPSPDVNAPSPEPDSDIELPNPDAPALVDDKLKCDIASGVNVYSMTETYNAGYYTPASNHSQQDFTNNGFSSFMGSNMPFDLQNFNASNIFSEATHPHAHSHTDSYSTAPHDVQHQHHNHHLPPPQQQQHMSEPQPVAQPYSTPTPQPQPVSQPGVNYNPNVPQQPVGGYGHNHGHAQPPGPGNQPGVGYAASAQQPLLPPPMPPFTTSGYMDTAPYTDTTYAPTTDSYANNSTYQAVGSAPYAVTSEVQTPYQPADAYNPEEDLETWEPEGAWDVPDLETPESPPMFEKEGFADPIEYDDSKSGLTGIGKDVDHRVLLPPPQMPPSLTGRFRMIGPDTDHRMNRMNSSKDVDHRNLISLTGSPGNDPSPSPGPGPGLLQPPPAPPSLWASHGDQDYRRHPGPPLGQDQDYRVPQDIAQQLKLPPPPPPPTKALLPNNKTIVPFKKQPGNHDNVESIDMDLSDDEANGAPVINSAQQQNDGGKRNSRPWYGNNKKIVTIVGTNSPEDALEPPPAPPHLNEPVTGKNENGPIGEVEEERLREPLLVPPTIPPLCNVTGPGWAEEWFDARPQFPPTNYNNHSHNHNRHKHDFRGGFRGRGRGFQPRGRPPNRSRPPRGGNPRAGLGYNGRGGPRGGFRGQFRGGF